MHILKKPPKEFLGIFIIYIIVEKEDTPINSLLIVSEFFFIATKWLAYGNNACF